MNRDRYRRQALVPGLDPDTLQGLHIAVVGAGAVGNEVVKNLAMMGIGAIDVHDFDRVEIHNLTRSIFLRESDVGRAKAAVVAARAAEVDPHVSLTAIEGDAWQTLPLAHLRERSALIACVDNIEARMRLSQLCLLAGVRFVNCGIDARFASVESMPFDADALPACFECGLPASAYARVAQRYSCGGLRRTALAERTVATTALTASVAGALAVQAALAPRDPGPALTRRILLDTRSGRSTVSTLARNPQCPACAEFATRPRIVPAGAHWAAACRVHAQGAAAVRLSDALIFDLGCRACGHRPDATLHVGRRADEFDERITLCPRCGEPAVRVEIHAEATLEELDRRLGGTAPAAKYLLADRLGDGSDWICIDLEDDTP